MDGSDAPAEAGRSFAAKLAERVDSRVDKVAKTVVQGHLAAYQEAIAEGNLRKMQAVAKDAVQAMRRDIDTDWSMLKHQLEKADTRLGTLSDLVSKLDLAQVSTAQQELMLELQRATVTRGELAAAQRDVLRKQADIEGVGRAIGALQDASIETYRKIGIRLAEVQDDMAKAAERAAALSVQELRDSTLKRLQDAVDDVASLAREEARKAGRSAEHAVTASAERAIEARFDVLKSAIDAMVAERDRVAARVADFEAKGGAIFADLAKRAETLETELVAKADAALRGEPGADIGPVVPRAFRGPYVEGRSYQRGDLVTFLGSTFIAVRATSERPYATADEDAPWQLFAAGGFGGFVGSARAAPASVPIDPEVTSKTIDGTATPEADANTATGDGWPWVVEAGELPIVTHNGNAYMFTGGSGSYGEAAGGTPLTADMFAALGGTGLDGEPGADGADGRTILSGTTAPDGAAGQDGDYYLRTTDYRLYGPKTAGAWGAGVTLVGPPGEPGAQGDPGAKGDPGDPGAPGDPGPKGDPGDPGADGRTILSGTTAPAAGTGVDGDFYIDTASATLYGPKAAGAWPAGTALVGPKGDQGDPGPQGDPGADGTSFSVDATGPLAERATYDAEPEGFAFLATDTGDLYLKNSATAADWSDPIPFVGPKGDPGDPGADGRTVLSGTTAPAAGTGADGDFYIDTATATLYGPKAAGAWPTGTALVGPKGDPGDPGAKGDPGDPGAPGADGRTVLNGAGAPAAGLGADGDFYIDTATIDTPGAASLYGPKAAGAWPAGVALKGNTGEKGDAGDPPPVVIDTVPPASPVAGTFYVVTA